MSKRPASLRSVVSDGRTMATARLSGGVEVHLCFDTESGRVRLRRWVPRFDGLGLIRESAISMGPDDLRCLTRALHEAECLISKFRLKQSTLPGPSAGPRAERK